MSFDIEEIVERVVRGEVKLHQLDSIMKSSNKATLARRLALEKMLKISLASTSHTLIDWDNAVGRNIENPIGAVQVPVGVAGPLLVRGEYASGYYYIPLATTEGALVASVNRGCKVVTESGGVKARILNDGMSRAPVFWTPSLEDAVSLINWVKENFDSLKREAESTTRHGKLKRIDPYLVGNNVWLRFIFETGDAMGMNMVTIATDKACKFIEKEFRRAKCISLSGNLCTDKKPALINALEGRGKSVIAEAIVKKDVITETLKTTPEAIVEVNTRKNLLGSARAGSLSYNAHYANILAAIFIATGQDVAQIVESSIGYTWTEINENGDLIISVTLPSLEVGTIGGGTWLPTQREMLKMLRVYGGGEPPGTNAKKFAEIVASTVLAGELNLLAAQAAGHLAESHKRLGRSLGR